tara:strand:- start:1705 stop:2694 length:990 start_codon:yes stop_codon:yes gene_type:complete
MPLETKLKFLQEEIASIKSSGVCISDDSRKAIIHDVDERNRETRWKAIGLAIGCLTAVISLIAYIGFESVEKRTAEYVASSELKERIVKELSIEREKSQELVDRANAAIASLEVQEAILTEKVNKLLNQIAVKEDSLVRVTNLIAKLGISNKDVRSAISTEDLYLLNVSKMFNFLNSFGLSELSAIKLLASETENFNFHRITTESLQTSIKQIQQRYELTSDGQLGPCTSLVVGALLLEHYEMETRQELEKSMYKDNSWLANSFQTCSSHDKSQIQRYLDYPDLPLHTELNSFISAMHLDRNKLLSNSLPNASAYKALSMIDYVQPDFE